MLPNGNREVSQYPSPSCSCPGAGYPVTECGCTEVRSTYSAITSPPALASFEEVEGTALLRNTIRVFLSALIKCCWFPSFSGLVPMFIISVFVLLMLAVLHTSSSVLLNMGCQLVAIPSHHSFKLVSFHGNRKSFLIVRYSLGCEKWIRRLCCLTLFEVFKKMSVYIRNHCSLPLPARACTS